MLIDQNKKLIFITPYKTGSHSLNAIMKGSKFIVHQHGKYRELKNKFPDLYEDVINNYKKYVTIRNPWTHAVSFYMHSIEKKITPQLFKDNPPEHIVRNLNTFKDFLKSRYYIPQSNITFNDNLFVYDKIIRFENFNEDTKLICEEIGIEYKDWNKNNGKEEKKVYYLNKEYPKDYRELYDDECIEIVRKKSENEINLLNYEF